VPIKLSSKANIGILILASLTFIVGGAVIWNRSQNPQPVIPDLGEVSGAKASIPNEFPPNIPVFEPAIIRSSTKSKNRIHLVLETTEDLDTVLEFYQKEMEQADWKGIETFQPKGGEAWSFTKNDQRLELITVRNETEEKTLIFLKTDLP